MTHFCTLFDSRYLPRGLALYESLLAHCPDSRLYVCAFDDRCLRILRQMNLLGVTVFPLSDMEDDALRRVKPQRSKAEYFWTCTPALIDYCLRTFNLVECAYVDADLAFYSSPTILLDEMKDDSVLITPHRYAPIYDQSGRSGVYCVQFMVFRNDENGLRALRWWKDACLEWCYARVEGNRYGDQKYLDDWPVRFAGIHVLAHHGGSLGPWNIQQYDVLWRNDRIFVRLKSGGQEYEVVYFHFHELRFLGNSSIDFGWYFLPRKAHDTFYRPYIKRLLEWERKVLMIDPECEFVCHELPGKKWKAMLKQVTGFGVRDRRKYLDERGNEASGCVR